MRGRWRLRVGRGIRGAPRSAARRRVLGAGRVGPRPGMPQATEGLGERRELVFERRHGWWWFAGGSPPPGGPGVFGAFAKNENPLRWAPEGAESWFAFSAPSRCARYGQHNSYDHGYHVGGEEGGSGGSAEHDADKTRPATLVKAAFEKSPWSLRRGRKVGG